MAKRVKAEDAPEVIVTAPPVTCEAAVHPQDVEQHAKVVHHLGAITNWGTLLSVLGTVTSRVKAAEAAAQAEADDVVRLAAEQAAKAVS